MSNSLRNGTPPDAAPDWGDVLDRISDLVLRLAPDGRILAANRAWRDAVGYDPAVPATPAWAELVVPEARAEAARLIAAAAAAGRSGPGTLALVGRDGMRVEIEGEFQREEEAGDRVTLRGVFRDVTAQRGATAALRLAHQRLELALDAAGTCTWDSDVIAGTIAFDSRWAAMLGQAPAPQTLPVRAVLAGVHPADRRIPVEAVRRVVDGEAESYAVEHRVRTASGGWIWIASRGRAVARDDRGVATRILGTSRDISLRKRAELEVRSSRQRLLEAMEAADMSDWDFDIPTATFTFSDRFFALNGTDVAREGGYEIAAERYLRDFCLPEDAGIVQQAIVAGTRQLDPARTYNIEYRTVRRDTGEVRHVVASYRIACDAAGRALRAWGAHQDITALRRAESSEHRLSQAIEQSPASVIITDLRGRIEYVNRRYCDLTGYRSEELVGRNPRLLRTPETPSEVYRDLWRTIQAGRDWEGELVNRRKDGTRFREYARIAPLRDRQGRITHYLGIKEDITARKQAEAEVIAQRGFLSTLQRTTLDLLSLGDLPEVFQLLVDRTATMLRAPVVGLWLREGDELILRAGTTAFPVAPGTRRGRADAPRSWRAVDSGRIVPPSEGADPGPAAAATADEACPFDGACFEVPIRLHADCVGVLALARVRPEPDFNAQELAHAGMLAHAAALVLHNAGTREAALREAVAQTAALRESEERFRSIFNHSPVPIVLADFPGGRTVAINDAVVKAWGLPPDRILGHTAGELGVWPAADTHQRIVDRLAREGAITSLETTVRHPSGRLLDVLFNAVVVNLGDRRYSLNSFLDLTSQKAAERERSRLESALRQSQKMESLGTLAGGIAHDFNNILTGIFGTLEFIRDTVGPDERELVAVATASAERAKALVQQILTFSRRHEGERKPLRLAPIVEEALRLLRSTIPAMVELRRDFAPGCGLVLADATQVHQVVMNLCTNAWHALPAADGRIAVTLARAAISPEQAAARPGIKAGPAVRLSVQDNGCGMVPETVARIFEPFFTTKEAGQGTGLGLAVVHGIIETHGGLIEVSSAPGAGSRFDVYFPSLATEEAAPAAPAPRPLPAGQGEHLLCVDDDPAVGQVIAAMLQRLNYRVTRCTSAEAALQTYRGAPGSFALVVSDLAMPGMSGAVLAQRMREVRPDAAILIVSGNVDPAMETTLRRVGVRAILRKPPSRLELAETVARLVRGSSGAAPGELRGTP